MLRARPESNFHHGEQERERNYMLWLKPDPKARSNNIFHHRGHRGEQEKSKQKRH